MRIFLLANLNSAHTKKWVNALSGAGYKLFVYSLEESDDKGNCGFSSGGAAFKITQNEGSLAKLKYLAKLAEVRRLVLQFKPDIVHAHYASSYGLLGALLSFRPFIVSVWGSDVFSFPLRSLFHRKALEFVLKRATRILSTSNVMAKEIARYSKNEISITPFGVDTGSFRKKVVRSLFDSNCLVFGSVKLLEQVYGLDIFIKAFAKLAESYPDLPLRMLIVGGGPQEAELKSLVEKLRLEDKTIFTGMVDHERVPEYHNMISVFVNVSLQESFGVSVIEASACSRPVIASNVGGLKEVVVPGVTGLLVPPGDVFSTMKAMEKFVLDRYLIQALGTNGRSFVEKNYSLDISLKKMLQVYGQVISEV